MLHHLLLNHLGLLLGRHLCLPHHSRGSFLGYFLNHEVTHGLHLLFLRRPRVAKYCSQSSGTNQEACRECQGYQPLAFLDDPSWGDPLLLPHLASCLGAFVELQLGLHAHFVVHKNYQKLLRLQHYVEDHQVILRGASSFDRDTAVAD